MSVDRRTFLKRLGLLAGGAASIGVVRLAVFGSDRERGPLGHPEPTTRPLSGPATTYRGSVSLSSLDIGPDQIVRFDPNASTTVEVSGNVVVQGTLQMRPSRADVVHTLRFVGVDEAAFVGDGMDVLASDPGLWVRDDGVLDLAGTPRVAWNRTGDDPSWSSNDELVLTPTEVEDYLGFRPFAKGSPVPRVHPQAPAAEVLNLTRNVRIEGTPTGRAHVHIMSMRPQQISDVAIRYMGPRQAGGRRKDSTQVVVGRYPLHFHHLMDASRGSTVTGVVVRDSGNHAFVPHMSNGITFTDCIAYNVQDEAYWWDVGDSSEDIVWDRCVTARTDDDAYSFGGFVLGIGHGNVCRDCVAVGVGGREGGGFKWGKKGIHDFGVWEFNEGNVAHNNKNDGIWVWQNDQDRHVVENYIGYRNLGAGIQHGAYANQYVYRDNLLLQNRQAGVIDHADSQNVDFALRFENQTIESSPVGFMKVSSPSPDHRILLSAITFEDCPETVVVEPGSTPPLIRD